MKWDNHADVVFKINPVTALAAEELKTGFQEPSNAAV
jgi:hypothetical protein